MILILEPDLAVSSLMATVLQDWEEQEAERYDTVIARTVHEATELLRDRRFDLVITEAIGQDSLFEFNPAFLDKLRSAARDTPIILCSSYPSADALQPGKYGLARVITKPFEVVEFRRKVDKVLAER